MRDTAEITVGAGVNSFKYDSYLAMRIGIAFVVYLVLMGVCLVLNPNENSPFLMATCACASLVFTVTFCVVCFDAFTKVKKITQNENDASSINGANKIATTAEPEEKKGAEAGSSNASGGANGSAGVSVSGTISNSAARKERCTTLGKKYGLTKREIEVFGLLLEGKNARDIENILYISRYTAKTHIGSVYRKIDVHSQQDLIDMFSQEGNHAE